MLTLSDSTLNKLSDYNGGRKPVSEHEVLTIVQNMLTIGVDSAIVELDPEDAQALKDHCEEFNYATYDEYVADSVKEALHMFLWGSTNGRMAYK